MALVRDFHFCVRKSSFINGSMVIQMKAIEPMHLDLAA